MRWIAGSRLLTMLAGSQALTIRPASFGVALLAAAAVRAVLGKVPFLTALLRP